MPQRFADAVAAEVLAIFQANLAAAITAIAAETGEPLDALTTFITGERGLRGGETYPAMWIFVQDGALDPEESHNQLTTPFGGLWKHGVEIGIAVVHATDPSVLRKRLYRYTQAVIKVIRDTDVAGHATIARLRVIAYSLQDVIEFARESEQRQDVVIRLEVSRAD